MARLLIGNIKGPQGAQGIQGPQGPVGATGPQGPMPDLVNNALATEAGVAALDAAMGKTLQDQIAQQNSNIGQIKLYSETMELNTSGYVDLPISDYESYKSDGYTGYVIMGYVFATGTISNAIHNIVQSNGVVRINYANSTPGSQPVRACILWRK